MPQQDERLAGARRMPLLIAAAVVAIATIALFRLPEALVAQFASDGPLSGPQADWAYRLMLLAAVAQAAYGGFVLLGVERLRRAQDGDPGALEGPPARIVRSLATIAAALVVLTVVYGLAAFFIQRERGGFWLFVVIAVGQLGWYYRRLGEAGRWLRLQPSRVVVPRVAYCPPLARGLRAP